MHSWYPVIGGRANLRQKQSCTLNTNLFSHGKGSPNRGSIEYRYYCICMYKKNSHPVIGGTVKLRQRTTNYIEHKLFAHDKGLPIRGHIEDMLYRARWPNR